MYTVYLQLRHDLLVVMSDAPGEPVSDGAEVLIVNRPRFTGEIAVDEVPKFQSRLRKAAASADVTSAASSAAATADATSGRMESTARPYAGGQRQRWSAPLASAATVAASSSATAVAAAATAAAAPPSAAATSPPPAPLPHPTAPDCSPRSLHQGKCRIHQAAPPRG